MPLFKRIYDDTVVRLVDAKREGNWWTIDVAGNRNRIVALTKRAGASSDSKAVCIFHDVERGLGHRDVDPGFARSVDGPAREALDRMLVIERAGGVRATYNVVGLLLEEVRAAVADGGHALAFHSHDHRIEKGLIPRLRHFGERAVVRVRPQLTSDYHQLNRCRLVDGRLKGYRAPRSRMTPGLNDRNLSQFNFEWLASSRSSLGIEQPCLRNGIVKIPVAADDYPLYRGAETYEEWERRVLALVDSQKFTAIGLHDCYAQFWLPHYESFLDKVRQVAPLETMDQVAARVTLSQAE